MSDLATTVAEKLTKESLGREEVEQVLRAARVTLSAAAPTPVRLRVGRVEFRGTKRFEDGAAVAEASAGASVVDLVPFSFSWELGPGVYGVGSHENLRGKTSVLEVIRWALRGRSGLTKVVQSWLEHVTVVFVVGSERLVVDFDVEGSRPVHGIVSLDGSAGPPLAQFEDEDAFEQAMGSVMMPRLQLQPVMSWVERDEQVAVHGWPAYAGALSVSSGGLGALLGDVAQAGLPSRLLSMFVGAAWVASRSEAVTALGEVESRRAKLQQRVSREEAADRTRRAEAEAAVEAAREALGSLPAVNGRLRQADDALEEATRLGVELAGLQVQLDDAVAVQRRAAAELQEEETQRHVLAEDALARRFFNALQPTACPRCAAPVTPQRRASEAEEHACSVCASDLDDAALTADVLVAKTAGEDEQAAAARVLAIDDADDLTEPVDLVEALRAAADAAAEEVKRLDGAVAAVRIRRTAAVDATSGGDVGGLTRRQWEGELALARAEGALAALGPRPGGAVQEELAELDRRRKVLKAAGQVTAAWVQAEQKETLERISGDIVKLAAGFGIEHVTGATLSGNATLALRQGGADTSYSKVSVGEKLRLKVATAVSLLRRGFERGVGRHPGLVTVDSLGSEEMAPEDFDAMVRELVEVAGGSEEMQVIIATRNADMLERLLPQDRRRVAPRGGYLW